MQIPNTYRPRDEPPAAIFQHGLGLKLWKVLASRRAFATEGKINLGLRGLLASPDEVITMGRWSYFHGVPTVHRYPGDPDARIEVGAFCSIAKDTAFVLSGNHDPQRVTTSPVRFLFDVEDYETSGEMSGRGSIVIGNDVWIGRGAMLLSGARIGDGAVIGARSVVSGTVGPYEIAVGNPARTVRKRFDDPTIDRLLNSQWWALSDNVLRTAIDLLSSTDTAAFLDHIEGLDLSADRTYPRTR